MMTLLPAIGFFTAAVMAQAPDLDALRWNSRVLLLFAPDTNDRQLARQKQMLDNQSDGLTERDLKVFEITHHSPADEQLRDKFHVKADSFAMVLVGKDGSKKLKRPEPTDPHEIFQLIDSMPMRRDEIRQRQ